MWYFEPYIDLSIWAQIKSIWKKIDECKRWWDDGVHLYMINNLSRYNNRAEKIALTKLFDEYIPKNPALLSNIDTSKNPWIHELISSKACKEALNKDPKIYEYIPVKHRTLQQYMLFSGRLAEIKKVLAEANMRDCSDILTGYNVEKCEFGVELEFNADKAAVELVFMLLSRIIDVKKCEKGTRNYDTWSIVPDNTARGVYEFVSPVITNRNGLVKFIRVLSCLQALYKNGFISINKDCGLHIHHNAHTLNYTDALNVAETYIENYHIISKLLDCSRAYNKYCLPHIPTATPEEELVLQSNDPRDIPKKLMHRAKSCAVNTFSYFYYGSLEFRQHEATYDIAEVLSWIELTHALMLSRDNHRMALNHTIFLSDLKLSDKTKAYYYTKLNGHN